MIKIIHMINQVESFELDDILDENDLKNTRIRFDQLKTIFVDQNSSTLHKIVKKFPILLTLDNQKIVNAKNKLQNFLPFIDLSYLFDQNDSGFELFLNCADVEFSLIDQMQNLKNITGIYNKNEFQYFVRRNPHSLSERYQVNQLIQINLLTLL